MLKSNFLCITTLVLLTVVVSGTVQAQKMYWAEKGTNKIRRADLDGANPEDILTGLSGPYDVAVDTSAGKIYWVETYRVRRANLDGGLWSEGWIRRASRTRVFFRTATGAVHRQLHHRAFFLCRQ